MNYPPNRWKQTPSSKNYLNFPHLLTGLYWNIVSGLLHWSSRSCLEAVNDGGCKFFSITTSRIFRLLCHKLNPNHNSRLCNNLFPQANLSLLLNSCFLSLKQPISICFLSCRKIKHLQAGKFTHSLFTTTWEPIQTQVSSASSNKLGIRLTEKDGNFFVLSFSLCYLKSEPERQRKPIQRSFNLLYKKNYFLGDMYVLKKEKKTLVVTTIPCCTL